MSRPDLNYIRACAWVVIGGAAVSGIVAIATLTMPLWWHLVRS